MVSPMTPIYGAAFLTVGMLSLFARQNHKQGWKKQRIPYAQAVHQIYEDFGLAPGDPPAVPNSPQRYARENHIQFSAQLIKMRSALGAGSIAPSMVEQEELQSLER